MSVADKETDIYFIEVRKQYSPKKYTAQKIIRSCMFSK